MVALRAKKTNPSKASKVIKYQPIKKFLAIDTEGTGLFPEHGCRAFAVSTCNQDGVTKYWECDVDPLTRKPLWTKKVLKQIYNYIHSYSVLVFHNMNFDIRMLSLLSPPEGDSVFEGFDIDVLESGFFDCHDTMIRAHIFGSDDSLNLKDQAEEHLGISNADEKRLDDAVKKLRNGQAKTLGWDIAVEGHPHLAGQSSLFHKCDFWLPRAIAKYDPSPANLELAKCCKEYAVNDAIRTAGLFILQENTFQQEPELLSAYDIPRKSLTAIYRMSKHGIDIHQKNLSSSFCKASYVRNSNIIAMQELLNDWGFNPNSSKDLTKALYETLKFEPIKLTPAGKPSTDKATLPELKVQCVNPPKKLKSINDIRLKFMDHLLAYREVNSAVTYQKSYRRFEINGKLYPSVNPTGTNTTRVSMSNPNGQNISKGKERIDENGNIYIVYSLRECFGPSKDYVWISIDYDQLQLRIFAYWSGDPKLIKAFEQGFDFHTYMAMQIFETDDPTKIQRRVAKNVNFGYIFGAGESKIDATCGIKGIYRRVQSLFPSATETINRTISQVKRNGYIELPTGYRLQVPKHRAYAGVNYSVQGIEGLIVKSAMISCDEFIQQEKVNALKLNDTLVPKMILQVHDELLFSFSRKSSFGYFNFAVNEFKRRMELAGTQLGIPCICKPDLIDNNWGAGKTYEYELAESVFNRKSNKCQMN